MINDVLNANCYSKDSMGSYMYVNLVQLSCFQMSSSADVIGRKDKDLPCQGGHAERLIENDNYIIKSGISQTFFESGPFNGKSQYYRSFKSPLLGRTGKIIGVQGISIPVSDFCLTPLTKQQTACLKELAMGKTHKQIAQALGLAQKTVEHYLEAVKLKLNCKSRAELILQAIERGLVGFL